MKSRNISTSRQKLLETLADPIAFISRLYIIDKNGKRIRLKPNQEQIEIVEALLENQDTLILKGRQIGSSTIVSAFLFWKVYTSTEPTTFAILSHKLASSKHLLEIHKTFYHNLPAFLKRPLSVENTTEIKFKDSGASIIAVSAEGKGGLRSFTCSMLHISEFAFAPNPEELKATALSALNNGQLIIESTANHFNDALHQEILKHENGEAKWRYLFFPWYRHLGYSLKIPKDEVFELSEEEENIKELFNLSDEQLYWRRDKISKLGKSKFKREFPATIEDAYSVAGNVYLQGKDFNDIQILTIEADYEYNSFNDVDASDSYAIGVDVAAGVSLDYSVIYVLSKRTYQPVCIYRSNEVSPVVLAERICDLATEYNGAKVLIESNNFGNVVINELRHLGYNNIWKTPDDKDWITTRKSKAQMFEHLKDMIQRGYVQYLDNIVYSELRAITVSENGDIVLPRIGGAHGDCAVAIALAYVCLESINVKNVPYLPAWIGKKNARRIINQGGVAVANKRRY